MMNAFTSHLWQSTFFVFAVALLTVAFRRNRAQVRYWLWLSGSFKFLIPFALLTNLGSHLEWLPAANRMATQINSPAVAYTLEQIRQPLFPDNVHSTPSSPDSVSWIPGTSLAMWMAGFGAIIVIRLLAWRRIRAIVRKSIAIDIPFTIEVRSSPDLLEPGVVGVFRPILLLPDGIMEQLSPAELKTVLAHELYHVRRRDNLFAAIHIMVEAMFWFHPLVWWIGARLVEERELACDEEVLSMGNRPEVYADAILSVCKLYTKSPLVCVSGVGGAGIRQRIEVIMANRGVQRLNRAKQILLTSAGLIALAGPVVVGLLMGVGNAPSIRAQSLAAGTPGFEVASIKPCDRGDVSGGRGAGGGNVGIKWSPGRLHAECMTLDSLVRDAYIRYADGKPWPVAVVGRRLSPVSSRLLAQTIKGSPAWIKSDRYSIEAKAEGAPAEEITRGPMMRALLEDRFKLKIHSEASDVPVYALTVAEGGPRLKPTKAGNCFVPDADHPRAPLMVPGQALSVSSMGCGLFVPSGRNGGFDMNGTTIGNLARSLSMVFDHDVIDQTGIQGMFDMHFDVHPEPLSAGSGTPADSAAGPGERIPTDDYRSDMAALFRAEMKKLGLKLTPEKGSVRFLVIDSVERPSAN
jgi:bla regulator protein BlaR1